MRQLLVYALERLPNTTALQAENGLHALQQIGLHKPDIVFTDLNMPVMDGWLLLETIRSEPTLSELPVVVLSTENSPIDRARAIAKGATSYLTKPVRAPRVLAEVRRLLGGK